MKRDRNHEGYHDPTAWKAIRRASLRKSRRRTKSQNGTALTYRLDEVPGFKKIMKSERM